MKLPEVSSSPRSQAPRPYLFSDGQNMFNTFKYHVFAPIGRFQLELIYLYFPPSFHLTVGSFCPVGLSLL